MFKDYLGDSVYAEVLPHGAIKLYLNNGYGPKDTIVLDGQVYRALTNYVERLNKEGIRFP